MNPIDFCELPILFFLLPENLHYGRSGQVFLQKSIDACNGCPDFSMGITDPDFEQQGGQYQERKNAKNTEGQFVIEQKEREHNSGKREYIVENRNYTGGKQLIQSIDIRGGAGHEPSNGILVEKGYIQFLQVPEDLHAQIAHDFLAHQIDEQRLAIA